MTKELKVTIERLIRDERKTCATIMITSLMEYVSDHPGLGLDEIATRMCDRKVVLPAALFDEAGEGR